MLFLALLFGLLGLFLAVGSGPFLFQYFFVPGEVSPATWTLAHPVSPATTSVDLLIRESECAGGSSPQGRIQPPVIVYGPTSISITIGVRGSSVPVGCPMNPEYPMTVQLSEPLDNRTLTGGVLP